MARCSRRFALALLLAPAWGQAAATDPGPMPGPMPGPTPHPMVIPAALRARTGTIEPSGLAWCPGLQRFLVVSDDTDEGDHRRRPWVLAMDTQGTLDADPVPIRGIDGLDDAEAIAPGPDDTYFLVTSHSPNHKGHVRPSRRQLLHLRRAGRVLKVVGRLDLRNLPGPSLLERAELPATGRLDIEGLGFHRGALLLGLKSPLRTTGAAVVMRIDHAIEALRRGAVAPGDVVHDSDAALAVEAGTGIVRQGIADLLVLADGTRIFAGNAPKGGIPDGGGALHVQRAPAPRAAGIGAAGHSAAGDGAASPGALGAPRLLQRFARLKPEGVALGPDGKSLYVVFDDDRGTPHWLVRPLPPGDTP